MYSQYPCCWREMVPPVHRFWRWEPHLHLTWSPDNRDSASIVCSAVCTPSIYRSKIIPLKIRPPGCIKSTNISFIISNKYMHLNETGFPTLGLKCKFMKSFLEILLEFVSGTVVHIYWWCHGPVTKLILISKDAWTTLYVCQCSAGI